MSSVSKIVVVVLHGQNCVFNENCLYKAILKKVPLPGTIPAIFLKKSSFHIII